MPSTSKALLQKLATKLEQETTALKIDFDRDYAAGNDVTQLDIDFTAIRTGVLNLLRLLGDVGDVWRPLCPTRLGNALQLVGLVKGVRQAIDNDEITSVETLVIADVSADLLTQAEHLEKKGYHLASAVYCRAVLEEHLRSWCRRKAPISKSLPTLSDFNDTLYRAKEIDQTSMERVQAMSVICNNAAHNKPEFDPTLVSWLLQELRSWLGINPLP